MTKQEKADAYLIAMILKGKVAHGRSPILDRDLFRMRDAGLIQWFLGAPGTTGWEPTAKGEALMNRRYPPLESENG